MQNIITKIIFAFTALVVAQHLSANSPWDPRPNQSDKEVVGYNADEAQVEEKE